jgi:hypothetical protein
MSRDLFLIYFVHRGLHEDITSLNYAIDLQQLIDCIGNEKSAIRHRVPFLS